MRNIIYSLIFLFISLNLSAQEYLRIGDVQNSWSTYNGSIDKAVFLVTPKGLYAECKMYLDISVDCTPFTNPVDSLEIQMGFRLPAEAEVTDEWLWINGQPVRAGMYDRWTASQIYETIVQRRRDPALLVKNSNTDYELHIFPLMVNLPRKVEITFMLPLSKLSEVQTQVSLPLNILKLSECAIDTMIVAVKPGANLDNPHLIEMPLQTFQWTTDPELGDCYETKLASIGNTSSLTLSFASANADNGFAGNYAKDNDEGTYQLEIDVAGLFDLQARKKTLFMIDFVQNNTSLGRTHVLQTLKNYIASSFTDGDSVNFMFSGVFTNTISTNWVSADSVSLTDLFNSIDTTMMTNTSNLPVMLIDGINFVQTHGDDGNIVLIASSNEFSYTDDANNLLDDVVSFMGNDKVPIHTINIDDYSYLNYYGSNFYYRGNEYLYLNLSVLTSGEFQTIVEYSFVDYYYWYYQTTYNSYESMLGHIIPLLTDYFTAVDVYASLDNGFTYSNYSVNTSSGFVYYGSPYRLTGKYVGDLPLQISVSALTKEGDLYNEEITIDESQMSVLDSTADDIWAGQYLRSMYALGQTSSVVSEIINASISNRVLSTYTAFLALEQDTVQTLSIPMIVNQGGGIGGGINEQPIVNTIGCYPNPASDKVWFEFEDAIPASTTISLYNLQGVEVTSMTSANLNGNHIIECNVSKLSPGVYLYYVKNEKGNVATGKLIVSR